MSASGQDAVPEAALLDQASRQGRRLALRHHPARDVAAEDVQDHVEVQVPPLLRPEKPRDVPGPCLVGRAGLDLGVRMVRMAALPPALPHRPPLAEDPVHCSLRAQADAFVQQRRVHLRGSAVREARRAQHVEDLAALRLAQRPGRPGTGLPLPGRRRSPAAVRRTSRRRDSRQAAPILFPGPR